MTPFVDHLLSVVGEEAVEPKRNLFRFYYYTRSLMPDADFSIMLAASKTLGRIAHLGGAAFDDRFVDFETQSAIELLSAEKQTNKTEANRYAAVLILKELAKHSPVYFYPHIGLVVEKILIALRDTHVLIRESGAELLAACLEITAQRDRSRESLDLHRILSDAQDGLKMPQTEVIHGSLLTYRELLVHASVVREVLASSTVPYSNLTQFVKVDYMDTANRIMSFKNYGDWIVRKTVIALIPALARHETQAFIEHHVHQALAHLLSQLDKPQERDFGENGITVLREYEVVHVARSIRRYRPSRRCCGKRHEVVC
jgi:serine/threonine-protein kinase mTOR